jgi:GGDEF domain-containing protein
MTTKAVEDVLMTREVFKVSSLDAIYEDEEEEWNGYDLEKLNCEPCQTFNLPIEERVVVETAMQQLKQIEQQVLHLFFEEGYNQTEIAHMLSISCNYVSHILRNATQKLRRIISEAEWLDEQRFRARALARGDFEARILDPQTGLFSADYLAVRLREEVQRAARYDQSVGFAVFEFAAEKSALDALGEFAIGELLLQASAVVRETVRKADIVGRYGAHDARLAAALRGRACAQYRRARSCRAHRVATDRFQPLHARAVPYPLRLGILPRRLRRSGTDDAPCRATAVGASGAGAPHARRGVNTAQRVPTCAHELRQSLGQRGRACPQAIDSGCPVFSIQCLRGRDWYNKCLCSEI